MSFFKKLFSSNYRDAVALEGAGRYREAAECYMLAGERGSVARMHRLLARSEQDPYARVDSLRKALDFLEGDPEALAEHRATWDAVRGDLARGLIALVDRSAVLDRSDRGRLEEAATILEELGDHSKAGEVLARLGYMQRAANAFKQSGDIAKMEQMFREMDHEDSDRSAFERAWDALQYAEMAGDHIGAIDALERCVELRPADAGLVGRLQTLRRRMPPCGRVTLRRGSRAWHLVGGSSVTIGREDDSEVLLLDSGISRRHARLSLHNGGIEIADAGSSHGTFHNGRKVERSTPLHARGEIRVGRDLQLTYELGKDGALPARFEVVTGTLKGQTFTWADQVLTTGIPPDEPEWLPAGFQFVFEKNYWHLHPGVEPTLLGEQTISAPTLLRVGDEITCGGATLRVE